MYLSSLQEFKGERWGGGSSVGEEMTETAETGKGASNFNMAD